MPICPIKWLKVSDARQRLSKARFDSLFAQLKLKAAAGQLTGGGLQEVGLLLIKE